ncbi:MAG: SprT-like domain-containing protein [Thermoplasmatota archaeon]
MDSKKDPADAVRLFEAEYEAVNERAYGGFLPPFPGVELVDRRDLFAATNTRGAGRWRQLEPFFVYRHARGELLVEAIRHEIAHAAALLFDDDEGHGSAWKRHAKLCGAREIATLDEGDPLRSGWPDP